MIEFVCGRAGSGKSEYTAEKIRAALTAAGDPLTGGRSKKIYLIVPEQQAVVWESRAARTFPPQAALSLEIVNFSRLSNLVARAYGGLADNYITKGGKAALMWSTLSSLSDSLTVYGGNTRPERASPILLSAISEMKRCGVTPADLVDAAERLAEEEESIPLARRLQDLSLIAASYQHMLRERYEDDEDDLAHLAMRLKEEPFFAGADVFVDSFFSLTPVENEIMYHIFRQAENVCVTFACPAKDTGEAQFASPRSFLAAMRRAADRAHREITVTELAENRRAAAPELAYLEENLWKFDAPAYEGDVSAIRVIKAADRYAEADAAVCRVEELIRGGARYADIALIARDAGHLRGILDTALERAGIPCFFSENADVPGRPAARLLFGALAVVGGGFRREDVLLCAKTGLCGLSDDECDALEMYTDTWHIRGARAFGTPWNMNPDGYTAQLTPRGEKLLASANDARDKLIPPLEQFASVFADRSTAPLPEICRACYELLCTCGVWDALRDSSAALHAAGRLREASEQSQLWDVLMDALDTLAEVLPTGRADAASASALLRQVLGAVRIGSIPGGTDEVVIGSADQVRLGEVKHIILLGAADGEFPGSPSEGGFFSDTDKIRLEGEGIILSSGTAERMKEELFWFYRAAALPHDTLTVLIPAAEGGTPLSPSLAAERILALFPTLKAEDSAAWTAEKTVWHPANARAQARLLRHTDAGEALRRIGALPDADTAAIPLSGKNEKVTADTAAQLFPRDIPLTQSRMDSFVLCRFGYYCKYIMKLEEKKEASLSAVNAGTFLHRVLELYFTRTAGEEFPLPPERMSTLTDEIVGDVVREICPPSAKSGRADYLFTRLKRCVMPVLRALDAEFAQSKFRPAAFELSMGAGDGSIPSMPVPTGNGHIVRLRGVVDRLDTWRDGDTTYVRVVDYKTGSKKFAREDIAVGVNVQLLLYLFSILNCPPGEFRRSLTGKRDGSIRAAGALYFSMRPGASTSDVLISRDEADRQVQDDILRSGVLLADEDVLRAMDADLSGKFIPVRAKKEGFSGTAAVSEAELKELERMTRESIARVGTEMCTGGAEAQPKKLHGQDPCEWCAMKEVCRTGGRKEESEDKEGS